MPEGAWVQVESIIRADQALDALRRSAYDISSTHLPSIFGKRKAYERAATLLTQATADADHAVDLLHEAGFGSISIGAIRNATYMLRDASASEINNSTLRSVGAAVSSLGQLVRRRETVKVATAQGIIDDVATHRYAGMTQLESRRGDELRAVAKELLAKDYDDMTSDDWIRLQGLLDADPGREIVRGTRQIDGDHSFQHHIQLHLAGKGYPDLRYYFRTAQLGGKSDDELRGVAKELFAKRYDDMTDDDWAQMHMLLDIDSDHTIVEGVRRIDGSYSFQEHIRLRLGGANTDGLRSYFTRLRRENNPGHEDAFVAALNDVAAGRPAQDSIVAVRDEGYSLEQLIEGRPPAQQSAIAHAMMSLPGASSVRTVGAPLMALRHSLAQQEVPAALEGLRQETITLIDQNLARISGYTPHGTVKGCFKHPEYAELGRIRSNVALINSMSRPASVTKTGEQLLTW